MFKRVALLLFASLLTTGPVVAAAPAGAPQLPPQPKVRPSGIPDGYLMVSPCVAGMGEHWANVKDMTAPIYGTNNGKVVFSEIMIPLKTLNSGYNYPNLTPLPGHSIDHVSIEWHPKGHPGMQIPHYDVHAFYVPLAQVKQICPNGVPDPDSNIKM